MQLNLTAKRTTQRRGVVILLTAISMVVLVTFAALTIDLGRMQAVRAELQRTADAAALAAVQELTKNPLNIALGLAEASAFEYVNHNLIENQYIAEYDAEFDLTFGQSRLTDAGDVQFFPDAMPPNSVRVTVSFDTPFIFAPVFGKTSGMQTVSATAATKPRDYVIVIDCSGSMTKQSVEQDVCDALTALGIPLPKKCAKGATKLTYDGSDPFFSQVYSIGDIFLDPSIPILPLKPTKDAAALSVAILESRGFDDLVGAVAYSSTVEWVERLTTDYTRVRAKLLGASKYGGTKLHLGIEAARIELESSRTRPLADKVIVLMTDGKSDFTLAMQEAQVAADAGMIIHTIGLGDPAAVDYALLDSIAAVGSGVSMYVGSVADPAVYGPQLEEVFISIATNTVGLGLVE